VSSVTRVQIVSGLKPGEAVALPVERPIKAGDEVRPIT
jgi:hypothetical protein